MSSELPPELRHAIDLRLEGERRSGLAERAALISSAYRSGRSSAGVVRDGLDATAYAMARLPATYAAGERAMRELSLRAPDFAPASLLDAGAGPGGSSWAAARTWPSLERVMLLDSNPAFLELAADLAREAEGPLARSDRIRVDLAAPVDLPAADLVLASYALTEIPEPDLVGAAYRLWAATRGVLLIVEPGTPEAWRRLMLVRAALIADGAAVAAPCPHALPCPIAAPDWCHFSQRLPRSRDHRLAKGAAAPFEDEKFAWLALARPEVRFDQAARVLAPPRKGKAGTEFKLCREDGRATHETVPKRDKAAYARVRRLDWGDALSD